MSSVTLIEGNASDYTGAADIVFTHPYAPLPRQLHGLPMLINLALPPKQRVERVRAGEEWAGGWLVPLSAWAEAEWNTVFCRNLPPRPIDLSDLRAEEGFFPEELPRRLFALYADLIPPGALVWDGFMGRGTVGKVAAAFGYRFVGMDVRADRVALARTYLGV